MKTKRDPKMNYRVVQWSTGNVGKLALHGIISHPDLELVGLWVHSPDKVGRDAGELVGLPATGVKATNDVDALLALEPDCVSYTATGDMRPSEAIDDMCRILASGANVVATSVVPLVFPPAADESVVARLQEACEQGGTTCPVSKRRGRTERSRQGAAARRDDSPPGAAEAAPRGMLRSGGTPQHKQKSRQTSELSFSMLKCRPARSQRLHPDLERPVHVVGRPLNSLTGSSVEALDLAD